MGIFSRKKKKPAEYNEISNSSLKVELADYALQTLIEGEDYIDLDKTLCQFGYLFMIEEHGVEALFKLITDKEKTFYFAAQKDSIMRLKFNDELFESTTETFLSMHK
jgi:hypothetical protein